MHPVLVDLGGIKLYSFGLMVALAFLTASRMVSSELARRRINPSKAEGYPLLALLSGFVGARLYYLVEHWDRFLADPLGSVFRSSGLTWYGGAAGGAAAVLFWAYRRKQRLWSVCDAFAPGLAAAYAIGRIGCQLAGDGDYGPPSDLPWAMAYPNGVVPTLVRVHPTPIYEVLAMGLVTALLWSLRTRAWADNGRLFGLYVVLAGAERFLVEFVRVNARVALGLTIAQLTSVVAVLAGLSILAFNRNMPPASAARPRAAAKQPKSVAAKRRVGRSAR